VTALNHPARVLGLPGALELTPRYASEYASAGLVSSDALSESKIAASLSPIARETKLSRGRAPPAKSALGTGSARRSSPGIYFDTVPQSGMFSASSSAWR
jgi:hypothetical protein